MSTDPESTGPRLTTTSYAILTQLALRPWSPYELVQQRVRYFRYTRPLTESAIYREVKRLDAMGLADSTTEHTGKRSRTVYSITDLGMDRLREWLDEPVEPIALEFEAMIRVFAAPVSTDAQIVAALEQVRDNAREMLGFGARVRREFLDGQNPLQEQAFARALVVDFRIRLFTMLAEWAEDSLEIVASWGDLPIEERNRMAVDAIRALQLPDVPDALDGPATPPDLERRHDSTGSND